VLEVAEQAAAAGARALCVISAGFAEAGAEGRSRQQELLSLCRRTNMRLVGPNCLGLVSTDPQHGFNATFCDAQPRRGGIALISQSGAVGIAALRHAERRGAGLSAFVSTGNKADVSGNDLLAWFSADPSTTAVALYLESFGNARKFARMAEAVGRSKPVVVVKAGRSPAGARAGQSHTAAAATPDVAIDAMLRACGVIRVDGLSDLFDVLSLLDGSAMPRGKRVAVVGNSGGPGVLAADACEAAGLVLADLSDDTRAVLQHLAPDGASLRNPVDLLATVPAEAFERALLALANDPGVDAVVTIYTPLVHGAEEAFAAAVNRVHRAHQDLCLIATFPGCATAPGTLTRGVPFFELPEDAIAALGRVVEHLQWRSRSSRQEAGQAPPDTADARAGIVRALADTPRWLSPAEATRLLEQLHVPCLPGVEVHDVEAAVEAAAHLGHPVALKAYGQALVHKARLGAVLLDLRSEDAVRQGYAQLIGTVGEAAEGVLVQPMLTAPAGLELLVGLARDPDVGPLVAAGAGGTLTEVLEDRVVALPPRDEATALEQLAALRCAPALAAAGDWPGPGVRAAAQVLLAVAALARSVPEVLELDINPLIVTPTGVQAVDVKVRVAPDAQPTGFAQRDLSPSHPPRSSS
jgi:acyl-CoA synthetase (NDP forming)